MSAFDYSFMRAKIEIEVQLSSEEAVTSELTNQDFENMMHYLIDAFQRHSKAFVKINGSVITLHNIKASQVIGDEEAREKRKQLIKKRQMLHDLLDELEVDSDEYQNLSQQLYVLSYEIKCLSNPSLDPHTPGYVLASGGEKYIFTLNDEFVIGLLKPDNITRNKLKELEKLWRNTVRDEMKMAQLLKDLGLEVQNYQLTLIEYNHYDLPVLVMPSFQWLSKCGLQVRDPRNAQCYGGSMLFGSSQNITPNNLKKILQIPCENIVTLLANSVKIHNDSVYIAIKDTPLTPNKREDAALLYSDLKQEIHLYFYDFTSQNNRLITRIEYENNRPTQQEIKKYATTYLFYAYRAVIQGLTPNEISTIKKELNFDNEECTVEDYIESAYLQVKNELIEDIVWKVSEKISFAPPVTMKKNMQFNFWEQAPVQGSQEMTIEPEDTLNNNEPTSNLS